MKIEILGAESMGVRSLATFVETLDHKILIDPSVAVTPKRDGLPPHPSESEAMREIRSAIQDRAQKANVIVITHFHHDHFSSFEVRPNNLTNPDVAREIYNDRPLYVKDWRNHLNHAQRRRAMQFIKALKQRVTPADGGTFGPMTFSPAVKHGEAGSRQGWVTMVEIEDGDQRFVFGSDIQLFESESVDWILDRKPEVILVSGPPIHLSVITDENKQKARANLMRLAETVPTTIVDHHLLRTVDYEGFIREAVEHASNNGTRVVTAAEFMGKPNRLLEANRRNLWNGLEL
jgi:predicted metallo-beta-lactamase superfamily hydrolase